MVTSPIWKAPKSNSSEQSNQIQQSYSSNFSLLQKPLTLPTSPLFGTDGIRGKAGELLSADLALKVGFWGGQVLRSSATTQGPVILGFDSRNSSDSLARALSAGINAAGLDVWNLGLCPTPAVAHLCRFTEAVGGVMISASHNPPEDNGIKFFNSEGTKLSLARQKQIEAGIRDFADCAKTNNILGEHYHRPDLLKDYVASLQLSVQSVTDLQGMRIVLDLAWGACSELAQQVFADLGVEVICLHDQPDGSRINVNCGSTHLNCLQEAVQQYSADMGFAFDGDADRVIAVDAQGRVVDGDHILYLWGQTLSQVEKLPENLIVATVMANLGFERAWEQLGYKLVRTKVGDQHVQAEMLRTGAMLGGEQSGHILCHHYSSTGDGMLTALHIASVVRQSGVSLTELVDQSFQKYPQLLLNVRVENRERRCRWQECDALTKEIAKAEASLGEQGRVLVRASGTEPVIRVMVEAISAELADYWGSQLVLAVKKNLT
ncbi:MAG: phosphoglucosamine mutase [Symploca sp. SIO2E9]|nr:phosphoglucosamine mutase [Symploca sp. SIO2E9]